MLARRPLHFVLATLAALAPLPARAAEPAPPEILVRCGRLLDVRAERFVENVELRIRQGEIVERTAASGAPAAGTLDLSGAYCLPGLIDVHAHLMFEQGDVARAYMTRSSARKTLDGLRNAGRYLDSGFTTLRVTGDGDAQYGTVELRDAIARGEIVGPRLVVAPHFLSPTGGHADLNELSPDLLSLGRGLIVDGPEEVRKAVRQEIKYGADWIKLFATGGVLSAATDPRQQAFTAEELAAAVEETHRHGRKICAHAIGTDGITAAVRAGVDSIEHGFLVDEPTLALMREKGTYLVPTIRILDFVVEDGARHGVPEDRIAKGRALLAERDRCLRRAFGAGVKLAFGTDTGPSPYGEGAREFGRLVDLGLTPMRALVAATLSAADLLGLERKIGSLEVGKRADLVAVMGDPLKDIRVLERVSFVMKDGRVVKDETKRPAAGR